MSDDHSHHIATLYEKISHLEGLIERTHRQGTVTDVDYSDATKPRARIAIGVDDQGQPVKGPWVAIMSHAGARTIHAPVTVGQQMMQVSPDGNLENGLLIPYGFSKPTPSPSTDPKAHVDNYGDVTTTLTNKSHARAVKNMKITHSADGFSLDMDGTMFAFSKSGLAVKNGKITHNDLNVGSSHVHGNVTAGGDNTGVPEA